MRFAFTCPFCTADLALDAAVVAEARPAAKPQPAPMIPSLHGRFGITPREALIADLAVRGFSCEQIAQRVDTTTQSVKNYLLKVHRRTGARTTRELMLVAIFGRVGLATLQGEGSVRK